MSTLDTAQAQDADIDLPHTSQIDSIAGNSTMAGGFVPLMRQLADIPNQYADIPADGIPDDTPYIEIRDTSRPPDPTNSSAPIRKMPLPTEAPVTLHRYAWTTIKGQSVRIDYAIDLPSIDAALRNNWTGDTGMVKFYPGYGESAGDTEHLGLQLAAKGQIAVRITYSGFYGSDAVPFVDENGTVVARGEGGNCDNPWDLMRAIAAVNAEIEDIRKAYQTLRLQNGKTGPMPEVIVTHSASKYIYDLYQTALDALVKDPEGKERTAQYKAKLETLNADPNAYALAKTEFEGFTRAIADPNIQADATNYRRSLSDPDRRYRKPGIYFSDPMLELAPQIHPIFSLDAALALTSRTATVWALGQIEALKSLSLFTNGSATYKMQEAARDRLPFGFYHPLPLLGLRYMHGEDLTQAKIYSAGLSAATAAAIVYGTGGYDLIVSAWDVLDQAFYDALVGNTVSVVYRNNCGWAPLCHDSEADGSFDDIAYRGGRLVGLQPFRYGKLLQGLVGGEKPVTVHQVMAETGHMSLADQGGPNDPVGAMAIIRYLLKASIKS